MGLRTRFQFHESDALFASLLHVRQQAESFRLDGDGWHRDSLDPREVLDRFPELWLLDGWRLRCAHFKSARGVGCLLTAQEKEAEFTLAETFDPSATGTDPFEAVDGEPGAWSYLISSMLRRELREWGASGAYCRWTKLSPLRADNAERLQSIRDIELPQDLRPEIVEDNSRVSVRFWSLRRENAQLSVHEHRDLYRPLGFDHESSDRLVAVAHPGDALFDSLDGC